MIRLISLTFLLFALFSCNDEEYTINNLNDNKISVLGHGGMGTGITIYPTNSLASIEKCLSYGAEGSELDVQLTKDGVLVAYHDHKLEESTNIEGLINSLNWEDIKGAYYNNIPFTKYPVISLDELFSSIENRNDYQFTFDSKLYNEQSDQGLFFSTYVDAINEVISKYELLSNVNIESQNEDFLQLLQQSNRDYKLFIYPSSFESGFEIAKRMDLFGITISTKIISKEQVKLAHKEGISIAIWGVNSRRKNKEGIIKNPDYIQTDRLGHLVGLLK